LFLHQAFVRGLHSESALRSIVVLVVLPFLDFLVEDLCVVDHDAAQELIELLVVDAMSVRWCRIGLRDAMWDFRVGEVVRRACSPRAQTAVNRY
jgi:hypothetical protein